MNDLASANRFRLGGIVLGVWLGLSSAAPAQPLAPPPDQPERPTGPSRPPPAALQAWQARYSQETKTKLLKSLPKPMFVEAANEVGLSFQHSVNPETRKIRAPLQIPMDIAGGGVSAADYDQDGFPDLFFCGFGGGQIGRAHV